MAERVSNAIAEQIKRSGGASYNQREFSMLAADLRDARATMHELVVLLVGSQHNANGTPYKRAQMAAKASDYFFKQTAGETAEKRQ